MPSMSRQQVSDLYFMEARSKVIDIAAFLDRMDRGTGAEDFRVQSLRKTLKVLLSDRSDRAAEVLRSLLKSINDARAASPPAFHADPEAVRALERDDDEGAPPTVRGWAP